MVEKPRKTPSGEPFADFGHAHADAVRGYLLAMVRRTDVADELAQEVFLRAWQARRRYCEQGTARAYLLRIADRLVCDRHRRSCREVNLDEQTWTRIEPAGPASDPARPMEQTEAVRQLAAALDELSPVQRRVLLLRYYGELSFAEIAEITECPLSTALSHCHRGLKALRKLLAENVT